MHLLLAFMVVSLAILLTIISIDVSLGATLGCVTLGLLVVAARYDLLQYYAIGGNGITEASKTSFTPDDMKPENPDENFMSTQSIDNQHQLFNTTHIDICETESNESTWEDSLELFYSCDEEHIDEKTLMKNKSFNLQKSAKRRLKKAKKLAKKKQIAGTEELTAPDSDDTPFTLVTSKKRSDKSQPAKPCNKDLNYELNPVFLKVKEATVTNKIASTMPPASSPTTSVSTSSTFPKIEILRNEEYHTDLSSMASASSEHFKDSEQSVADLMSSETVMENEDISQLMSEESTVMPTDEERKKRVMMTKAPFARIGMTDPKAILLFLQQIAVQHSLGIPIYVRYWPERTLLRVQFNSCGDADSFRFGFGDICHKEPLLQRMNPKPIVRRDFTIEETKDFRKSQKFVTRENRKAQCKKYILKNTRPELNQEYFNVAERNARAPELSTQDAPPVFHSMQPVPLFQPVMGNPYSMVYMTNNTFGPVNQILLTNNTTPPYGWFNYGNNTMMPSTSSSKLNGNCWQWVRYVYNSRTIPSTWTSGNMRVGRGCCVKSKKSSWRRKIQTETVMNKKESVRGETAIDFEDISPQITAVPSSIPALVPYLSSIRSPSGPVATPYSSTLPTLFSHSPIPFVLKYTEYSTLRNTYQFKRCCPFQHPLPSTCEFH